MEAWRVSMLREVAANWQTAGIKPVIVDAGANVGYSALYFASLFPGVCVLAVEANRTSFEILAHAWYYDESISSFVAGPGERAFEEVAHFDRGIIDGAVNGVAGLVRFGASKLRLAQTGYVRNYALGIAVGAFILVGLFLTRAGA